MDLETFKIRLLDKTYEILKNNLPYREPYEYTYKRGYTDRNGQYHEKGTTVVRNGGPKGKPGTSFYSPYPGNLKNNGVYRTKDSIVLDVKKVGYIPFADKRAHKHTNGGTNGGPDFIRRTENDVVDHLRRIGCKVVKET